MHTFQRPRFRASVNLRSFSSKPKEASPPLLPLSGQLPAEQPWPPPGPPGDSRDDFFLGRRGGKMRGNKNHRRWGSSSLCLWSEQQERIPGSPGAGPGRRPSPAAPLDSSTHVLRESARLAVDAVKQPPLLRHPLQR